MRYYLTLMIVTAAYCGAAALALGIKIARERAVGAVACAVVLGALLCWFTHALGRYLAEREFRRKHGNI